MNDSISLNSYSVFLQDLNDRIRTTQIKTALSVNRELIFLYWHIGKEIQRRCDEDGWGSKVIEQLAKDIKKEFPDVKGFSARNLTYMRTFAKAYSDFEITQQLVARIPWGHHCLILDSTQNEQERLWYVQKAFEHGWSRKVLSVQIDSKLFQRKGAAITNFEQTLPKPDSDLTREIIKDPFNLAFLTLEDAAHEKDLERGLISHIRDFLIELGFGFAFVGSQYQIIVDDYEYRIDLLFYHLRLYRYVVIELKIGPFKPDFAGQMNFYVTAIDKLIKTERDNPTIGIILCRSKRKTTVEFALQDLNKPIGVATYTLQEKLPEDLLENFPSADVLLQELESAASALESSESLESEEASP